MYGMVGIGLYIHPLFLPFTIYKECYRMEINIRGLNEKNDKYYNELL